MRNGRRGVALSLCARRDTGCYRGVWVAQITPEGAPPDVECQHGPALARRILNAAVLSEPRPIPGPQHHVARLKEGDLLRPGRRIPAQRFVDTGAPDRGQSHRERPRSRVAASRGSVPPKRQPLKHPSPRSSRRAWTTTSTSTPSASTADAPRPAACSSIGSSSRLPRQLRSLAKPSSAHGLGLAVAARRRLPSGPSGR